MCILQKLEELGNHFVEVALQSWSSEISGSTKTDDEFKFENQEEINDLLKERCNISSLWDETVEYIIVRYCHKKLNNIEIKFSSQAKWDTLEYAINLEYSEICNEYKYKKINGV